MNLLIRNAKIATMNEDFPQAEAAVVCGEYFAYVGTEAGARKYLAEHPMDSVEEIDCGGQFVMPGFNDSHMHYLHYVKAKTSIDLVGTKSMAELVRRMKKGFEQYNPDSGMWVTGEGWNHDFFEDEKRFPTVKELDEVTKDYPILIMRACFHIGVLNSKAMEMLNINKDTVGQYGVYAETYEDGTPNGIVKEHVLDNIKSDLPAPGLDELVTMVCDGQRDLFEYGVTSVQSDDFKYVPEGCSLEMMQKLRAAAEDGRLKLRIAEQALLPTMAELKEFFEKGFGDQFGGHTFKIAVVKLLQDGSLGARTAQMRKPYLDDSSTTGIPIYTQEELNELVLETHKHNMGAIVHAIGDGASEVVLNAIENAQKAMPYLRPRHGIVHCQITDQTQKMRYKELDLCAYTQPIFIDYDMNIVYDRMEKSLAETSYAWRDYRRLGVHQAFGTDCPVESFKPLPGIYCAVTRKSLRGEGPYLPEQAVDMQTALYLYTAAGAYCSGEEDIKGMIKPGMLADFILMDKNLLEVSESEILDAKVLKTFVGGECVYKA